MNVFGVLLRAGQVQGQPQDRLIILTHQSVKGCARTLLGLANQIIFERAGL